MAYFCFTVNTVCGCNNTADTQARKHSCCHSSTLTRVTITQVGATVDNSRFHHLDKILGPSLAPFKYFIPNSYLWDTAW